MAATPAAPPFRELKERLGALTLRDEQRLRRRFDRVRRHPDELLERFEADLRKAEARLERRRALVPERIEYPEQLPVSARREDLLAAIRDHQVVVVAGETGSGKTTQLPKLCLELGRGVRGTIAHTQPRRLAARTVAQRIADELGTPLGSAVGYAVRFSDRSSEDTLVRLVTDGLLLAEIQHDPLLRRYDTIIVDEAHERSLNIDFLLGCIKRVLPRRPELKLIITSATIDPQRFAEHFGDGVPVVEVSGRTYPVEVRYRERTEEDGDEDPVDAIGDAVEELSGEGPGDVLVFLSGEREIRDTAEALQGRLPQHVEILPLYARLSNEEQNRVFRPSPSTRRVVLATNVAETSLTVPGIRYVVDPGTARISRYSARLKVQRLPIEKISQASADQRKGRCGRVAEGICIRLYDEEDFEARPRFTDPEILRTNLASVILQMAALDLGAIEDFPFLDPPDRRQIRDGVLLLQELGALDAEQRLTQLGRRIAQLPVDPRLARMVLEADRRACADEVIIIAAALSIQDPRERPQDKREHADQLHARFRDEQSDFLAYLNLWRHLREQQRELSGNQFRKRCKAEYLHYLRVREWQDLVAQLRQSAKAVGVHRNQQPAEPQPVHLALLSGLLSHVGLKDAAKRNEYVGARNARFAIAPGSALHRRNPTWVMVAELVETSRLWGRTAARVQPEWIEPLAGHLVKRSYDEPHWERKRASVVATERVTLYGLPIGHKSVAYGGIDPVLSREVFIRKALVEGDWDTRHHFLRDNEQLRKEVEELEERTRQRGLVADDHRIFAFYDERVPGTVVSGAHFDRWWRDERRRSPELLTLRREHLVDPAAAVDARAYPEAWKQGDLQLRLSYRFAPGRENDGVTVHVPLSALGTIRAVGFDWLVPGYRLELVTTLLRSLPKDVRRELVPVPETAARVVAALQPRRKPFLQAVADLLPRVEPAMFDPGRLPPHLRMTFRVEDEDGRLLAEGDDLEALKAELRPKLRRELGARTRDLERTGARDWVFGTIPRELELSGVKVHPALVDEGATVGLRVFETQAAQAASMRAGTRRLLLLCAPDPARHVLKGLDRAAQLALAAAPSGPRAVVADAAAASADALMDAAGGPVFDEAGFRRLRDHVAGHLAETTAKVMRHVTILLGVTRDLERRLDEVPPEYADVRADVEQQLRRLVHPGFVTAAGVQRLPDLLRYLRGAIRRLERLPNAPAVDRDRMRAIHELEDLHERALATGRPVDPEVRWMLEELRIAQFAQGVGVAGGVSAKRIRAALASPAAS